MTSTIAVLLTCHNRKEKTLECLQNLFEASLPNLYTIEVFLVDDGSTDGTGEVVRSEFPEVSVIAGDGNLFWNQGMRLAWKTAAKQREHDFYLWLNDDTILEKNALIDILKCHEEIVLKYKKPGIITSACRKDPENKFFSYGGRSEKGPIIPNGNIQPCTFINGNAVLVPKEIYRDIGILSSDYTHGMGDFDYGLRAKQMGFKCYTTKTYVAVCPTNEETPGWCDPQKSFRKRWALFHSPIGLNIQEYIIFRKKFWKNKWVGYAVKAYFRVIFPKLHSKMSQL